MTDAYQPGVQVTVRPFGRSVPSDPYADSPEWKPPGGAAGASSGDPYAQSPEWKPSEQKAPGREVGTGEALGRGAIAGASFGFEPALAGLREAAGSDVNEFLDKNASMLPGRQATVLGLKHTIGAGKLIYDALAGHPEAKDAYERGRKAALEDQNLAAEQHPWAYTAGQMAGAAAMPLPGLGAIKAATLGPRLMRGAGAGAAAGGLAGTGEAVSEGEGVPGVAGRAAIGGVLGGTMGGALGGAIGPRLASPGLSPGQKAALTAENLGASIPKGLASDNRAIQTATSGAQSIPILGTSIRRQVENTATKAGEHIKDIVSQKAGGVTDRATADMLTRKGLEGVIDQNRATIDAAYNGVRSLIDRTQKYTMPATDAVLNRIMAARKAAGWTNPAQGLEQFRNVAGGATIEGAHRARVDAREAGNVLVPHPGYNKGEFNQLTKAMTADIRGMVNASGGPRALKAFDNAEKEFGRLADQNDILHGLVKAKGEAALGTILGAASEKGGNLKLLAQLRNSMTPKDFEQVGGVLLNELGHGRGGKEFSLQSFATDWGKLSDRAKAVMFSPSHLADINDIVGLTKHLGKALRETNTSHTAGSIILFDLARDAILLGASLGSGAAVGAGMLGSAAAATPGLIFAKWLSSPAKVASMSAWTRAYRGITLNQPTPARIAAFNIATRNLANNLGVPVQNILKRVSAMAIGDNSEQPSAPRP